MSLGLGARIGPYEVTALLGEGGMGKVWRARHTALNRDDALKVLPEAFATDPERLARFRREAQVLASLNHPNIAHVYGFEQANGVQALVMELVEGPTLADRIAQGPIPVDEALAIAKQIAEALEAAHGQGIVHRDLKPANIKLRPDGTVKVLDFGLAKALQPASAAHGDATASPTVTSPAMMTGVGVLLGTAAYMSPEQARGKSVDRRSDIWAFGCVLYEMLTGARVFGGDTISDTIANVLKAEPDWARLPADVPSHVRSVLRAGLQKDPKQRVGDAQTVRIVLEGAFDGPVFVPHSDAATKAALWRRALPWAGALALAALLVGAASGVIARPPARPPARFVLTAADAPVFNGFAGTQNLAISPDGTRIVYRASSGGRTHLYARRIDQLHGVSLFSAEGEFTNPVVSPDGAWVVFRGPDRTWKKVSIAGGPAVTIAQAAAPRPGSGASWTREDTIVFSEETGLFRMTATGGERIAVSLPDNSGDAERHLWPEVLPGGNAILFTAIKGIGIQNQEIAVLDLRTGDRRTLIAGSRPRYSVTGHLIYGVGGTLMAVPFDAQRLQVTGNPVPVLEGILTDAFTGAAEFALAENGSLVYVAGQSPQVRRSFVWVDRQGREQAVTAPPRPYTSPRISPDGSKLLVNVRDEEQDIWFWDFRREALTRLTFGRERDGFPVWSPDGRRVAYSSNRDGSRGNLFWQAVDGSASAERLAEDDGAQIFPTAFSPDGSRLLVYGDGASTADDDDIGVVDVTGQPRVMPLLRTTFNEQNAEISPDGRWVAYNSDESGRHEVYVRPFPDVDKGGWQVSTTGGGQPTWARNGRELFFRNGAAVMSVSIQTNSGFAAGPPQVIFEGEYATPAGGRTYDVSPDGRRFLMIKEGIAGTNAVPPAQMILVQNWTEELKRLVPTN